VEPVVIVGAGIAGIAAARALRSSGVEVVVLDRGRRIGGRMAVRTTDERPVDTGASYFTVSDPAFRVVVDDWRQRGLAREWTDTFHVCAEGRLTPKPGPMRWAAAGGLRSLVEDLADGLDVRQQQVSQVGPGPSVDGRAAAAVVLAMPDPQARRVLHPSLASEAAALTDPYDPVLVLTAVWDRRCWPSDVEGVFVQGNEAISWIADDGHRRGDGAPVLVAHSTSTLAAKHLAAPEAARGPLVEALCDLLSIPEAPSATHLHRWSYAKPATTREASFFLGSGIGCCGDSWSTKPRVEAAFLSGSALGHAVAERLA